MNTKKVVFIGLGVAGGLVGSYILIRMFSTGTATAHKPILNTASSNNNNVVGGGGGGVVPSSPSTASGVIPFSNTYDKRVYDLQVRLNRSRRIAGLKLLDEDGKLGNLTATAIKDSFPNIGSSVINNRFITPSQYKTIMDSIPSGSSFWTAGL